MDHTSFTQLDYSFSTQADQVPSNSMRFNIKPARRSQRARLRDIAANAARQTDVAWKHGDTLRVNGAQIGVLEQVDEVRLGRLLQRVHGDTLETDVGVEILRHFANQALER